MSDQEELKPQEHQNDQASEGDDYPPSGKGLGIGAGIAIGAGIGIALGNLAIGIGVGIAMGAGFSLINRSRNKK